MEHKQYEYIFFDLDGTLTDPGEGITNSVMYALKRFKIEAEREELYKFIGPPLVDSFKEFYGFSDSDAWTAVRYYREYFADRGLYENRVYDGIEDVLGRLAASGRRLYVATSKPTEYSVRILKKFGFLDYFEYVSGSSMDEKNSSKKMIIARAVEHCGMDVSHILMVGDRRYDIEGAKAHGMDSAGVLFGYGSRQELEDAGADYIIEKVEDLLQFAD